MKFGSQYGWGVQLNCLMFITLFSYLSTAALLYQGELNLELSVLDVRAYLL